MAAAMIAIADLKKLPQEQGWKDQTNYFSHSSGHNQTHVLMRADGSFEAVNVDDNEKSATKAGTLDFARHDIGTYTYDKHSHVCHFKFDQSLATQVATDVEDYANKDVLSEVPTEQQENPHVWTTKIVGGGLQAWPVPSGGKGHFNGMEALTGTVTHTALHTKEETTTAGTEHTHEHKKHHHHHKSTGVDDGDVTHLNVEQLQEKLEALGINHSDCKTKDELIVKLALNQK